MKSEMPNEGTATNLRKAVYEEKFLLQVHKLLELGYFAIGKEDYSNTDEETISGDISEAIEEILDKRTEPWMAFYDVHNEKPVQQKGSGKNDRTREGKKRQRIDIEFVSAEASPRLRFPFEAKLLCDSKSVSAYVGSSGLGCFVKAEYGANDQAAGMLGFIQSRTRAEWMTKIEAKMGQNKRILCAAAATPWRDSKLSVANSLVKVSNHTRAHRLGMFKVFHTLLDFCQTD